VLWLACIALYSLPCLPGLFGFSKIEIAGKEGTWQAGWCVDDEWLVGRLLVMNSLVLESIDG